MLAGAFPIFAYGSSAIVQSVAILGPLMGATAAWDSIQLRLTGTDDDWTLSIDGGRAALAQWICGLLTWAALGFFAVCAAVLIPISMAATWGTPNWIWLTGALLSTLLQTATGALLGACLPFFAMPVAVAVALFGSNLLVQFLEPVFQRPNISLLAPAFYQAQALAFGANAPLLTLQAGWFSALLVSVLGLLALAFRQRRAVALMIAGIGTLAAGGLASLIVMSSTGFFIFNTAGWSYACDDKAPTICIHPALLVEREAIRKALTPLMERSAGTPFSAREYDWTNRGYLGEPRHGAIAFHLDGRSEQWAADLQIELAQDLLTPQSGSEGPCEHFTTAEQNSAFVGLSSIVTSWLSGHSELLVVNGDQENAAAREFAEMSARTRATWIGAHLPAICSGRLTPSDFK